MMKSTLINAMKGFVLGSTLTTGVVLLSFEGMDNLKSIESLTDNYVQKAESHASMLAEEYWGVVDNANAEIKDYQVALEQANNNITDLITAYEGKVTELTNANAKYEEDLADLQEELNNMKQSVDQQYEATVNQLNGEIQKANDEVEKTTRYVDDKIHQSYITLYGDDVSGWISGKEYDEFGNKHEQLDTTGEPKATDIPSNIEIPTEQPTEQQGE